MKNTMSERLNYLMVLAEEQNMTRAAARLFISQPALTAYLNRLENDLGIKLFDRSSSPVKITEAGAYYISEMEKICAMQDRLAQELKHFNSDPDLKLSIGIGRNRGSIWLPQILPAVYRAYPDAQLNVVEDRDVNMIEKVINGVLDVAVVETYAYHSMLSYLRLPQEYHLFVTSRQNPLLAGCDLAGNSITHPLDMDAERLSGQLFICPSVKGSLNRHTQWMCSTYDFHPKRTLFVSNAVTAYRLVVNGVGITFENAAYSTFIQADGEPVFLMPGGKPSTYHVFAIFNGNRVTPLQRAFMEITHGLMSQAAYGQRTEMEYM